MENFMRMLLHLTYHDIVNFIVQTFCCFNLKGLDYLVFSRITVSVRLNLPMYTGRALLFLLTAPLHDCP